MTNTHPRGSAAQLAVYYALIVTQTVSLIGSQISQYAVSIAVFRATGHATPLALVAFFSIIPAVLLGGLGGALADRFDRRGLMLIANAGYVVTSGLLIPAIRRLEADLPDYAATPAPTVAVVIDQAGAAPDEDRMKAAVLNSCGAPLDIETLPDPAPRAGEVVIDVVAAGVTSYAARVFNGSRNYLLETPVAPGAGGIGRVPATGPDATRLKVGDWVYCDPTIRSRDNGDDTILLGWTYRTPAALPLHRVYHHGSFAEQMLVPAENATPLGDIDAADAGKWTALGRLLVPYGGLLAGALQAGETLVVSGATGGFGGAGVAVALAMGAARVVATGRNVGTLEDLARIFGPRVRPAQMSGVEADDRQRIVEAAGGPIDLVLDFLPREATASQVMAPALAVRHGGRIVLMGGLRGAEGELPFNYNWLMHQGVTVRGHWMYERDAIPRMVRMIRAGLIDLAQFELAEFGLDDANQAIAHAAANAGPRQLTALRPDRAG